ncbi:MAG TPA: hypothetical protein VHE79_00320 [Spirochaetia bacterium]
MTTTRIRSALLTVVLLLATAPLFALDIGLSTWVGNFGFRPDRTSTDATFPGADYFWGIDASATQTIADAFTFETGFTMDPILRNTVYTLFTYNERILTVAVGPFFGVLNTDSTLLKSGITTSITLQLPGVVFATFRSDSSIGSAMVVTGDYVQSRSDIALGFYVPNAICTLSMSSKSFELNGSSGDTTVDGLTEYAFSTNIFQKNVPYQLTVKFAYQTLSRSYVGATTSASTLNSIVIGTELDVSLGGSWTLQAGIEGNVYSFGQGNLVGSDPNFLFRTFAGVRTSVDSLPGLSGLL